MKRDSLFLFIYFVFTSSSFFFFLANNHILKLSQNPGGESDLCREEEYKLNEAQTGCSLSNKQTKYICQYHLLLSSSA